MALAKKFGSPLGHRKETKRQQAMTLSIMRLVTGNLYLTPKDPRLNPSISYSKTNAVSGSSEICAIGM